MFFKKVSFISIAIMNILKCGCGHRAVASPLRSDRGADTHLHLTALPLPPGGSGTPPLVARVGRQR